MAKGFYHPDRGYWQTIGEVPQRIIDGYPIGTVEVPLKPSAIHEWQNGAWVEVTPDPAEILAAERAAMVCTRQQGKLALGPTVWASVLTMVDDPDTPWGLRVAIEDTVEWRRTDEDMQALVWAMGLSEEQADDLFRLAMTL